MNLKEIVEWVIRELEGKSDEERREKSKSYYPTSMRVLGVPVPQQREVVRSLVKLLKGTPADHKISLANELIGTGIFECQQVAYEMLSRERKVMERLGPGELMELRKGFDNWISVDTWSTYLAGVAWREGRIPDDTVLEWTGSIDPWVRRSALVCTIPLNQKSRGGKGDTERTLMICARLVGDDDRMVRKALSWALRELSKHDRDAVEKFIEEHGDDLPIGVIREVERKISTGLKGGLPNTVHQYRIRGS